MFAIRVQGLTRGPLGQLPKPKAGGPSLRTFGQAMGAILRGGSKAGAAGRNGADLLTDVSFEIEQGTIVAFPGADLRAVEALMRIMTASLQPTSGKVEVNGTIGGLLKVGENLEADLTGRESVLRERSYLGVPDDRVEEYLAQVLEFSGMKDFEDVQARRYSTGMSLRLGLAMILVARPSIIVLGDIMGVGDLDFHQRCMEKIRQLNDDGVTFLLCGPAFGVHDLADRILSVERGTITSDVVAVGHGEIETAENEPVEHNWHVVTGAVASLAVALADVRVIPPTDDRQMTELRLRWRIRNAPTQIWPIVDFLRDNTVVFRSVAPHEIKAERRGWVRTSILVPPMLAPMPYRIRILCDSLYNNGKRQLRVAHAVDLVPAKPMSASRAQAAPFLQPDLDWEIEPVEVAE